MNKPLPRRAFLKLAAAAPLAAQKLAAEAIAPKAAELAGLQLGLAQATIPASAGSGALGRLLALRKAGMPLPAWLMRQVRRQVVMYDSRVSPEIASMKSLSLASKFRIDRERRVEQALASMEESYLDQLAEAAFRGNSDANAPQASIIPY